MSVNLALHAFQLCFQSQLVNTAQVLQPASMLNGAGDALKNRGQLLDGLVLRIVKSGLEMARWVSEGQGLFPGARNGMAPEVEIAVEIFSFAGQTKDFFLHGRGQRELDLVALILRRILVLRFDGTA